MTNEEKEAWQKEQAVRAAKQTADIDALPPGIPLTFCGGKFARK